MIKMSKKLKIGIDIDEVLRAKWVQFEKYYNEEFGEDGIPADPYTSDFFGSYKFNDTTEKIKVLKEPEEMPDNINPIEYQVDSRFNEAPADAFLFKKPEEIKLSAKEVYNRFLYEDYLFEIHGAAPKTYTNVDIHVNNFLEKYQDFAEFSVVAVENKFSIPPTLFFLSKVSARFRNYRFIDKITDVWNHVDVYITADSELLKGGAPWGKKLIKIKRPFNEKINVGALQVFQISDLNDNKKFEKIIKFKK